MLRVKDLPEIRAAIERISCVEGLISKADFNLGSSHQSIGFHRDSEDVEAAAVHRAIVGALRFYRKVLMQRLLRLGIEVENEDG